MPNTKKSALILTYQQLITRKKISIDIKQKDILKRLDVLLNEVSAFSRRKRGFLSKLLFLRSVKDRRPKGVYIYGDVGRGKSFLMDLFYEHLPFGVRGKRCHFHAFMKEIHEKINKKRDKGEGDVISSICHDIGEKTDIICFDEMQVNDIADAMVIGRLFEGLFLNGVTMVVTSNRHPDDLYKDGLQRDRFLPFIEMFKTYMDVVQLSGAHDYRMKHLKSLDKTYFTPLGERSERFIENAYKELTGGTGNDKVSIDVKGRSIKVPRAHMGVAMFSFNDLCDTALGSEDYIEIAKQFNTIIIRDIPELSKDEYDKAIRFIHLVDALYEHKVTLICSADADPKQLYTEGERSFEFERTASRLIEMQSEKYLTREHKV